MQKHFSRISGYMNPYKIMLIHNKKLNHKIKRLNEKYACVFCDESSLSMHYRNMQVLAHKFLESTMGYLKKHLTEILPLIQPIDYNIRI